MKSFDYTIKDELGIHARPAGTIVKAAKAFASDLKLEANGKSANLKGVMGIMSLAVKQGVTIKVTAEGDDEDKAIKEIEELFKSTL